MAIVTTDDTCYESIAEIIRIYFNIVYGADSAEANQTFRPVDMAGAIMDVVTAVYEMGVSDGKAKG